MDREDKMLVREWRDVFRRLAELVEESTSGASVDAGKLLDLIRLEAERGAPSGAPVCPECGEGDDIEPRLDAFDEPSWMCGHGHMFPR